MPVPGRWLSVVPVCMLLLVVAPAASSATCRISWKAVASPRIDGAELFAVAASAADNAWAVGGPSSWSSVVRPRTTAVIDHWDGTHWTVAPSPRVAGVLEGVAIAAPDDVWAVGEQGRSRPTGFGEGRGLGAVVEHWDGVEWTQVAVPGLQRLSAVAAASSGDVWAVGRSVDGSAVILHWDGSQWTWMVYRPRIELLDVVAVSPTDVWAVGDSEGKRFVEMHWDGNRWSTYSQPLPRAAKDPAAVAELVAVAGGGNDLWAAGDVADGSGEWGYLVVLHWQRGTWRVSPATGEPEWVQALAIRASGDVLLAGLEGDWLGYGQTGSGPDVGRWHDHGWRPTSLPHGAWIDGFANDRDGNLWAVGFTGRGSTYQNGFPAQTAALITHGVCT